MMSAHDLWLTGTILAAAAGSYLWRGLGVWLSGRVTADSAVMRWVTCVSYAMLSALIARMLLLPEGPLATTPLIDRVIACAVGLIALFALRRNTLAAVIIGSATLALLATLRAYAVL
ncbi:MAG TPA: AzlD domain-containing protein [Alphaproteobacteria bacterium]|jgi:branched-subunit amino acid transport protein